MMGAKIKRKSIKQLWEGYYPIILGLLCLGAFFVFKTNTDQEGVLRRLFTGDTMSLMITIESILVGFVLTILAFIIQMDNKALVLMKELGMYKRLINFGKSAIHSALIVVSISFIIFLLPPIRNHEWLQYVWVGVSSWSVFSIYRFIRIFFIVAKSA